MHSRAGTPVLPRPARASQSPARSAGGPASTSRARYRTGGYLAGPGSVVGGAAYVIEHDVPGRSPPPLAGCTAHPASRRFRDTGADVSELAAELGHRRGFLLPGQLAPSGVMPGGAGELRDEDAVTIRTAVSHVSSVADLYGNLAPNCEDGEGSQR